MKLASRPPIGGLLYSLLHLGGFAGDLSFYTDRCSAASRVLELGSGDGRVAAALCRGELHLSTMQAQLEPPESPTKLPPRAVPLEAYLGIEMRDEFVEKAVARLGAPAEPSATGAAGEGASESGAGVARFLRADFLEPLPASTPPFDAAVVSANTLFCTPRHAELLSRCAEAVPAASSPV